MKNVRFLIDLTTSRGYKGHNPVGIVRTEREIAKAFIASKYPVDFFRFELESKALWIIPRHEAASIVGALNGTAGNAQPPGKGPLTAPEIVTDDSLRAFLGEIQRWLSAVPVIETPKPASEMRQEEALELFDGDVIISAGLLWDGNFLELVYALKQTKQILVAQILYDIVPIIIPEFCVPGMNIRFPKFLLDAAWTADAFYCISDCTLRDVGKYLREHALPEPRLLRVELGADLLRHRDQKATLGRTLKSGKFVVYVSTIEPRKNHAMLFHVWRSLYETSRESLVPLIIVGRQGWNSSDLITMIQAAEHLHPQYIRIMTEVSDADLDWLYRNASFTVYPSLYEGWGLPVAESLARGKFCIAANASSIPEVGAGLAELIDPLDVIAWTQAIRHYLQAPQEVAARESTIRQEYRTVSWESAMLRFVASVTSFVASATVPETVDAAADEAA